MTRNVVHIYTREIDFNLELDIEFLGIRMLKGTPEYYEWLDKFEKIIICPDNDEPGQQHLHNLVKVLPRNKVFIMDLPYKDANECLQKGKPNAIINGMFKPRAYTPSGIIRI